MKLSTSDSFRANTTDVPLKLANLILNHTVFTTEAHNKIGDKIVSDQTYFIFTIINYVVLCTVVSLFGIFANAANIIVFKRQGFNDTINISFFAMAISDLILQLMTLWCCICFNPWFESADTPFKGGDVLYFMGGGIQVIATRVTGWITAFVTLERCLCIAMPLKVKHIITPRRTKALNIIIFIVSTICMLPSYFTVTIEWVFNPNQNRSMIALIPIESRRDLQNAVHFYLNNVVLALAIFVVIAVCTFVLAVNINRSSRRREKLSMAAMKENTGAKVRDKGVIKMVTLVAVIYIVCYTPTAGIFIWAVEDPEFSITGRLRNLFLLLSSFAFLFESANSSMNIFIYFYMSSKYRDTFLSIFCKSRS